MKEVAALVIIASLSIAVSQEFGGHALFVRTPSPAAHSRVRRAAPLSAADVMAQNILEWIQGIYRQGTRKTRQQSDPTGYLPPYSTQRPPERPRPFQAPSTVQRPTYSSPSQNEVTNYPYQRPSTVYSPPNLSPSPSSNPNIAVGSVPSQFSTEKSTYLPPSSYNPRPTYSSTPSYSNSGSSVFPPYGSTVTSSQRTPSSTQTPRPGGYGQFSTSYSYSSPVPSSTYVPPQEGPSSPVAGYPSVTYGYPTGRPTSPFPTAETGTTSQVYGQQGYPSGQSVDTTSGFNEVGPVETSGGSGRPSGESTSGSGTATDDDANHPPHIHSLDVECSKTMMTINIEFNRVFDGVIYSKGFYTNPECRYVEQNSGQTRYSFTVSLDSCGTQFINDFGGQADQAYLENVLVLQNEPGIQEVWDTVRRVRCLWEGNINKALTVNFSVDMLNQEIVTFSGDTAVAKLDIQAGRGPFAPIADGLVKIGETMTLVVSVEGDDAFDLQVRDCLARDESSTNTIQLTDERGCILKPKLFGAFQKTNDTGNTGASIIAYAFFQAFKFPDVMDLFIECNVELCKTDCEPCPETNQQIEPGRRRRSITYAYTSNSSTNGSSPVLLSDPVRVARGLRVVMEDDLSIASNRVLDHLEEIVIGQWSKDTMHLCMTHISFYTATSFLLITVLTSIVFALVLYIKLQRIHRSKFVCS